ncbi:MAG: hypothetical protein EXR50_00150 [Dehalococcoidia bacterium]|nr:hypothetical protein [Dehalococcoidia bacterium]
MKFRSAPDLLVQLWKWSIFAVVGFAHSVQSNLGIGFLSLALSTVLWVFVTSEQNPPRDGIVSELITVQPVNVPTGLASVGELERVSVRISAPQDIWKGVDANTFEASIDLSELGQGKRDVPVRLHSKDSRVIVRDVLPARVGVELDVIKSKSVPVRLNITDGPPQGYIVSQVDLPINVANISGPARLVELVDLVSADVDLKGLKSDLRQVILLVPGTGSGYDVQQVRVDPPTIALQIPISREVDFLEVPVLPNVVGGPQNGYWVSSVSVSPATVAIVGPRDLLQTISFLKTRPLDISGSISDISQLLPLNLPNELRLVTSTQIRVDIKVLPADGVRIFQITPGLPGLAAGRAAILDVSAIEVTLAGPAPVLSKLTQADIPVSLRLENKGVGTFTVDVSLSLPPNLTLVKLSPDKVQVTIK